MMTDDGSGTRPEGEWDILLGKLEVAIDNGDIAGAKEIIKKYKTNNWAENESRIDPNYPEPRG